MTPKERLQNPPDSCMLPMAAPQPERDLAPPTDAPSIIVV